jgi:exonuclease SbcD
LAYSFSEAGQSKAVVLVEITPQSEVREELIYLKSGRPLVRWQATGGAAEVEQWVAEGRDAGCWIDLELHVPDVIDPAEYQRLRKLSDNFVKVQRVLVKGESRGTQEAGEGGAGEREELTATQLFCRFYERKRGAKPDDKLVQLFSRLMAAAGSRQGGEE